MFANIIRRPLPIARPISNIDKAADDCTGAAKTGAQSSGVLDIIGGAVIGLALALVVVH